MLNSYLQQAQSFIRDRAQKFVNPDDLRVFINRARREVALRTQCIRVLTPMSGGVISITVTNPGQNYSASPTVTISAPDQPNGQQPYPTGAQATATANVLLGTISNIAVPFGGSGYTFPTVTITDSTGTGATAVAHVQPINVTQQGQEVYPFSAVPLNIFPGVGAIFFVRSVSFIYANYRYSIPCYPFSTYQAFIRQYPKQYQYVPTMCAQLGQGSNGSIYMYPIPSTIYQMEWDACCLPEDLLDDTTFEAIPQPWDDCVPFGAAMYAFLEVQNLNAAKFYQELFDSYCHKYSAYTRAGRITNPYGKF